MYITITVKINDAEYNIKIDNRQKIYVLLEILKESGSCVCDIFPTFYKSHQNKDIVSAYNTFEQSEINSGDVLEAILD